MPSHQKRLFRRLHHVNRPLTAFIFLILTLVSPLNGEPYSLKPLDSSLMPAGLTPRVFSLQDLESHDGKDDSLPVYMAVRGVVFDVSEGKQFYGKDSAYNVLAGRDASRAIAKMSLDEVDLTDDLAGLTDEELEDLDKRFVETYKTKYPVVGFTVKAIGENLNLFASKPPKEEL